MFQPRILRRARPAGTKNWDFKHILDVKSLAGFVKFKKLSSFRVEGSFFQLHYRMLKSYRLSSGAPQSPNSKSSSNFLMASVAALHFGPAARPCPASRATASICRDHFQDTGAELKAQWAS
jgi:hypothetical protein